MANIRPGDLNQSVAFDMMTNVPDGQGGHTRQPMSIETRAHYRFLRGGEAVIASRLSGVQPVVVTIRRNELTREITTTTVMRDLRTGTKYNIRAIITTDDRKFLEITAQSGVTVGGP